jgi:serine/threonine protein kinase
MIGQTFGQYRIEAQLGAGGMGVVYRAFDTELQRPVAIKVLGEAADDETTYQRLLREARAASALNHPNICAVHEVRQANGKTFIVMEYVEGRSLGDLIPAGGLPVESVVRYGLQIADALTSAQEKGIVHRDLKSSNIVITPEGRVKGLDFGLARRLPSSEQADITRSQETGVSGTLAYMAPEVLSGTTADSRSDIWALGVVLYEMAAGRLPFRGQTGSDAI